jgi:ABC-type branched-subunit amino acid transport system substrate-binding protein
MKRPSMRVVAVLTLAAVVMATFAPATARAQGGSVKIGMLAPLTGPFAQIGKDMVNGTELYLDEIGRQMGGRKVELIVEDDEGNPATALNKTRKLVEQDKVHIVTGGLLANVGYALQPYLDGQRVPATYPVMAADDITQRKPAKYIVRTGWATSQPMHPFAEWVVKNTKYRKVAFIGMDYAFGYETLGGFQHVFEREGGQIVQKIWTPLNTNDFAPFLAQIKRDADAVLGLFVGRLALQFMKQYEESGLKGKLPLLGGGTLTDESVLPQMGDEAIGTITALHYSQALDNPANQKVRPGLRSPVRQDLVVLLRGLLHERAMDRRGREGAGRQGRRQGRVFGRAEEGGDQGHRAGPPHHRQVGQPGAEHLHPQGRARGRQAAERGDRHDSCRRPVLEVQSRRVHEDAALQPRLSAVQGVLARAARLCGPGPRPERPRRE